MKISKVLGMSLAVLPLMLIGCGGGDDAGSTAPPSTPSPTPGGGEPIGVTGAGGGAGAAFTPEQLAKLAKTVTMVKPTAGAPVAQESDVTKLQLLASNMGFVARKDPFALLPAEKAFENEQRREFIFSESPSFDTYFEIPEEKPDESQTLEPPPAGWRLAGVMTGNGISAIMTNGTFPALDIKPGTQIPGTEWFVVSIDAEKAVLRRTNNKRPREWVVRLQGAFDLPNSGGGDTNSGDNTPAGGRGGAPPPPGGRPGEDRPEF